MQHVTTIEINGIATEVMIHYTNRFGEIIIVSMHDLDGDAIAPDLLDEMSEESVHDLMGELAMASV